MGADGGGDWKTQKSALSTGPHDVTPLQPPDTARLFKVTDVS